MTPLGLKCTFSSQPTFGTGLSVWWNNGKWGVRSVQETVIISILLGAAEIKYTSPLRLEWILGTLKVPNSLIVVCPCRCNLLLYQAECRGPAGSKHALAFKQPAKTCFELLKL